MPLRPARADWCPTTATDARALYYNPEYIATLTPAETRFVLAHEALHCGLSHFARRQHRIKRRWDLACDHAVNPLLIEDGLTPPPNALFLPRFAGLTAEEIYPLLDEQDASETLDVHVYDDTTDGRGGLPQDQRPRRQAPSATEPETVAAAPPVPLTPDERETLAAQWRQRLAGAAQQAAQAGKLGGHWQRIIEHLLQPRLPWRMLLARYLSATAREDYSYSRPSRRDSVALLPRRQSHQIELVVAVDLSGSLSATEIAQFIGEIDALKGQLRARIALLPCDAALSPGAPFQCEPWEALRLPKTLRGGGGTDFTPVFAWVARAGMHPDALVYFTDGQGRFPPAAPSYPVLWLIKGRATVPWGQRIQLN